MYIPLENLGILENDRTGWIGREIYGAGQVFRAYLLWEAYGKSDDRDIMVLSLNDYKELNLNRLVDRKLEYIIYNPEEILSK